MMLVGERSRRCVHVVRHDLRYAQARLRRLIVHRPRHTHLARQIQAVWIFVRDHHVPRRRMPNHRRAHDADWTSARDEYIFAEHRKGQCGVHGVAKGSKIAATSKSTFSL